MQLKTNECLGRGTKQLSERTGAIIKQHTIQAIRGAANIDVANIDGVDSVRQTDRQRHQLELRRLGAQRRTDHRNNHETCEDSGYVKGAHVPQSTAEAQDLLMVPQQ
jgi:hypothetical protein